MLLLFIVFCIFSLFSFLQIVGAEVVVEVAVGLVDVVDVEVLTEGGVEEVEASEEEEVVVGVEVINVKYEQLFATVTLVYMNETCTR